MPFEAEVYWDRSLVEVTKADGIKENRTDMRKLWRHDPVLSLD